MQYPGSAVLYKLAADGTRLGEKTASYASILGPEGFDLIGTPGEYLGYKYEDGRGALTSITDELNGSAIVASYQVDATGRTKAETRGGTTKAFSWDAEGRLRSLTVTPPAPGTAWTASYAYVLRAELTA